MNNSGEHLKRCRWFAYEYINTYTWRRHNSLNAFQAIHLHMFNKSYCRKVKSASVALQFVRAAPTQTPASAAKYTIGLIVVLALDSCRYWWQMSVAQTRTSLFSSLAYVAKLPACQFLALNYAWICMWITHTGLEDIRVTRSLHACAAFIAWIHLRYVGRFVYESFKVCVDFRSRLHYSLKTLWHSFM